ncbi:hypothetical protein L209DRAFT_752769 [Thermothelomyces heterothallicus CBS 203.75]
MWGRRHAIIITSSVAVKLFLHPEIQAALRQIRSAAVKLLTNPRDHIRMSLPVTARLSPGTLATVESGRRIAKSLLIVCLHLGNGLSSLFSADSHP